MNFLYILLAIFVFGLLIFIHELGHFIVARLFGVKILEFSIGMGPKLISWVSKKNGTRYSLRLFPIGGFVNMLGERGMETLQGKNGMEEGEKDAPDALSAPEVDETPASPTAEAEEASAPLTAEAEEASAPLPAEEKGAEASPQDATEDFAHAYCNLPPVKRILISAAGPLMNILFGFLLMIVLVIASGTPLSTQIGGFHVTYQGEDAILAEQGLQKGDYLYLIDGENVSFETLRNAVQKANGKPIPMVIQRLNETGTDSVFLKKEITLTEEDLALFQGSRSEESGLRIEDTVLKINSTHIHTFDELRYEIMNQCYVPATVTVLRDGETKVIENVVFPNTYDNGIAFGVIDFRLYEEDGLSIGSVLHQAFYRSISSVKSVFDSLFGLVSGRFGVESVSGPVGITVAFGEVASYGMINLLYLIILITLNLGIINLCPFPAFDGGHIILHLLEIIRRKPLKRETEAMINFIGILLLISLAVFITFKDIFVLL